MQASTREAPGETRPSATTSGTRECANVKRQGFEVDKTRSRIASPQAGSGPTIAAVERREASVRKGARRLASACGPTSLARRRVPLHPGACRRSAPSHGREGKQQTSEEQYLARTMMRACRNFADAGMTRSAARPVRLKEKYLKAMAGKENFEFSASYSACKTEKDCGSGPPPADDKARRATLKLLQSDCGLVPCGPWPDSNQHDVATNRF